MFVVRICDQDSRSSAFHLFANKNKEAPQLGHRVSLSLSISASGCKGPNQSSIVDLQWEKS